MRRALGLASSLALVTALGLSAAGAFPVDGKQPPRFWVHPQWLATDGWPAGVELRLTADDPTTAVAPDIVVTLTTNGEGFAERGGVLPGFSPGWRVTLTDGVTTKKHTVRDISITGVDPGTDVVRGTADPGAPVWVSGSDLPDGEGVWAQAGAGGKWQADFSGLFNIKVGTEMGVQQFDEDGDSTYVVRTARAELEPLDPATLKGEIAGGVTDGSNPIADIIVRAEASTVDGWVLSSATRTGSDGTYTLERLAPGAYRVTFVDPAGRFPPEVYHRASSTSPTLVDIAPGATTAGIDAAIELPAPVASELPAPAASGPPRPVASGPELGLPKIVAVTAGGSHYCLLGDDGTVWCWGNNGFGQLGNGTTEHAPVPVRVEGIPGSVQQVVALHQSTCALTESGGVWCWGWNENETLGDGTTENRLVPTRVLGLDSGVDKLASHGDFFHMCAIRADGSGACWGNGNFSGQLGDGTTDARVGAVRVTATNDRLSQIIPAGSGSTCALTERGAVRCWGALWSGGEGRTEEGATEGTAAVTPIGLGAGVKALWASQEIVCALMDEGSVRCWDWGVNPESWSVSSPWKPGPVPEVVPGLPGGIETVELTSYVGSKSGTPDDATTVAWACGTRGDRAWCWGNNDQGQLGDGTMIDRPSPVEVQTGNLAQLAVASVSSLALLRDGSLVMWGNGDPTPRSPFFAPPKPATTAFRPPDTLVPAITTYIPTPADISTDPPVVGANLLLAALAMLVLTIATELLNRSLGQADPILKRRFRPIGGLDRARARLDTALIGRFGGAGHARRANALRILGIAVFYGIVFALLDPTWNPFSVTGLWLVLIMAVAFGIVGLSGDIAAWATARRWGIAGDLAVKPGSLLTAVGSTLFTRVLVLVPGVMIGSPEALEVHPEGLDRRRLGGLAGVGLGTVLAIGLVAWLGTLVTTVFRGGGEVVDDLVGGVEAFLLLVFAAAVQNGFVQLLSLRESAGLALRRAYRLPWAITLLGVTFLFWHTLVNPRGDLAEALGSTNVQAFLVTVGIVFAAAVAVWTALAVVRRRGVRGTEVELVTSPAIAPPLEVLVPAQMPLEAAVLGVDPPGPLARDQPAGSTLPPAGMAIAEELPEPPTAAVHAGP